MTRARRSLVLLALVALLLGAGAAVGPWLLWGDGADYSHVVSIRHTSEYQAPELLEKAWSLPVARLYRDHVEFQQNASFCGPASLVNVLRSQGRPGSQKTVLDGTGVLTLAGMLPGGLSLDELAAVSRQKVSSRVTVLRDLDLGGFQ
jgi:hypothetical protein